MFNSGVYPLSDGLVSWSFLSPYVWFRGLKGLVLSSPMAFLLLYLCQGFTACPLVSCVLSEVASWNRETDVDTGAKRWVRGFGR